MVVLQSRRGNYIVLEVVLLLDCIVFFLLFFSWESVREQELQEIDVAGVLKLRVEVGQSGMTTGGHAVYLDSRSYTADAETE